MRSFIHQLRPALLMLVAFTMVTGLAYPLVLTGVGQSVFHSKANGSLVERDGLVVGSSLIGQQFSDPKYFWPRPSAAGTGYDATASSGSNLGPTNDDLLAAVTERVAQYRAANGLDDVVPVPVDAVTASASGLDPQISVANATLQAGRVAKSRNLGVDQVLALVRDNTDQRPLGFLGDQGVNVLKLNLALDDLAR
ncbi:MAG: K(+)-transporting ATPase subunit C [Acidimicrobiales bacterium]